MYQLAANLTLTLHFIFIIFVVFGSILFLVQKKIIFLHVPALFWGAYVELSHSICPLTYLENWFLRKAKLTTYSEGFISNYIFPIVYPVDLTMEIQTCLGIILMVVNVISYGLIFKNRF